MNPSNAELAGLIDHTVLKPGCTQADVERACRETAACGFAAVVVPPLYVPWAVGEMNGTGIPVCSVVSFPFGWDLPGHKCDKAAGLLDLGAGEIDMVMNLALFFSGQTEMVRDEIAAVREVCGGGVILKVIIETAYLDDNQIVAAAQIGAGAGADFIKTSTGFAPRGAAPRDVELINAAVGGRVGIKAAGGIRTREQALSLIEAGATRLGCSTSVDLLVKA